MVYFLFFITLVLAQNDTKIFEEAWNSTEATVTQLTSCFGCIMADKDFSKNMFQYEHLSYVDENDNYYCTFDKTCRAKNDPDMAFRSCERGLQTCLLFDSEYAGNYLVDNEEHVIEIPLNEKVTKLQFSNPSKTERGYYQFMVYKDGNPISITSNEVLIGKYQPHK